MAKSNNATKSDLEVLKKEIKTAITESEIKVLGELQDMREEFSIHQFSHSRINDEIQELQKAVGPTGI
jgi:septin family protein